MKTLTDIEYKGFNIVIKGKYQWDGWYRCNTVQLKTYVFNNQIELKEFGDRVNEDFDFKVFGLAIKKKTPHKKLVEEMIQENITYSKNEIDRYYHEQEMTDGLLDSLD
jgi:hypothetical protein